MFVVSCVTGYGSGYTVTCIQGPGSCMPYNVYMYIVHVHIIRYKATSFILLSITDCSTSFGSSSSSSASSSSSFSSSSITSHVDMIVVPIFNRKIISTFDSRAAGAGISIAMLQSIIISINIISLILYQKRGGFQQSVKDDKGT